MGPFVLSSDFSWCVNYSAVAQLIFNVNPMLKHLKLMLNDLHILHQLGGRTTLRWNDPVLNPILPGGIPPLLFFLHNHKTAQGIKLNLSDFKDTPLRQILQVKPVC